MACWAVSGRRRGAAMVVVRDALRWTAAASGAPLVDVVAGPRRLRVLAAVGGRRLRLGSAADGRGG
eukprot:8884161-Pyramimonas_sp.AAC.1